MFDLGGGSLECLSGLSGAVELADSLPLGVLRLAKLDPGEIANRVRDIAGPIVRAIRERAPDEVILSSGTARALLRVGRRLGRERVVSCLSADMLAELARELPAMSPRALGALGVSASRLDTIGTGVNILATVVELVGVPLVRIATATLRDGVALEATAAGVRARRVHAPTFALRRSA